MTIVQALYVVTMPVGEQTFTANGNFVVPNDVFTIEAVLVGGGGGAARGANGSEQPGASGAGLRWINDLPVTPGETITVEVGTGGPGNTATGFGTSGKPSRLLRGANILVEAGAGSASGTLGAGGVVFGPSGGTGTATGDGPFGGTIGGGNGGAGGNTEGTNNGGGGGAGGYSGNGGPGVSNNATFLAGTNGGAGGGGAGGASSGTAAGNGGGVGIYGEGASGSTASAGGSSTTASATTPTTTGTAGGPAGTAGGTGGSYGGGGGGADNNNSGTGGGGAVRIIWGPNRAFPATRTTFL